MILQDYVKKLLRDYFIILGVLVFAVTILSSEWGCAVTMNNLHILMIGALGMDLARSIAPSPGVAKGKTIYSGIGTQLIAIEAGFLLPAHLLGLAQGYMQMMALAFEIAVIYLIVRFIIWQANKKDAKQINRRLECMKRRKGSMFGLNH